MSKDIYIHRFIEDNLLNWKLNNSDKVLLVSGCRQVGKTTTILEFARHEYKNVIYINVATDIFVKELATASWYSIVECIRQISKKLGVTYADDPSTILILDEIQESKAVYERIRLFSRGLKCHVIVTVSYLGRLKNVCQPMGDVYKLQMYPLSYQEYLYYFNGYNYFKEHSIEEICNNQEVFSWYAAIYDVYKIVGGYPEVFVNYLNSKPIEGCFRDLVEVFSDDVKGNINFASDYDKLSRMFQAICAAMAREKKGAIGNLNIVSQLTEQDDRKRLNKKECNNLLEWMSESHILSYADRVDLESDEVYPSGRMYFEDIGLANYLCDTYNIDKSAKNGLLAETFVYKQLVENDFLDRFYFDRPAFAISINKLLYSEMIDIVVNARGSSSYGSKNQKYTIPIFLFSKFEFNEGPKVSRETIGIIENFSKVEQRLFSNNNITGTADSIVFRRSIVARLENFLASPKRIAALIGPWKCGKTFALKQLMAGKNNCIYYDCKSMSEQEKLGLFDNLIDYLQRYELIIIDEITYAEMPDVLLNKLANAIDGGTAKVIITGSQLVSIDYWVNMTMPTKCEKIYLCFLDFNEWVSFRGLDINSLSESDFLDYLQNSADFFGITDNKAYLERCITETIISNKNAINIIPGNTELVPEEIDNIIAFLFVNFIKLHARVNWEFHLDPKRIATKIWDNVKDSHGIKYTQFVEEFCGEFNKQHSFFSKITLENLREYLRFLIKIDFITITDGLGDCTKLQRWLWGVGEAPIDNVVAFYKRYTVQVKYPMFYYNFLREFACFGEITLKDYNNSVVMGSALECYVRGLISYETESCVMDEFAPDTGGEIDYVDKTNLKALGTDGFGKCIKRVYEKSTQKKITRWKITV